MKSSRTLSGAILVILLAIAAARADEAASFGSSDGPRCESRSGFGLVDRLSALARSMLDVPYRFGGDSVRGIDCSAFVRRVFGYLAVHLPRSAREQFELGTAISREALAPGDLVFFRTYARFASHVGIYLGNDEFIHAAASGRPGRVRIDRLGSPYFSARFLGARRILDTTPAASE